LLAQSEDEGGEEPRGRGRGRQWMSWSELLRRVFEIEVLVCGECGGRCRILAVIEGEQQGEVVEKILRSVRGRSPPERV
jgi:hypothetical protein